MTGAVKLNASGKTVSIINLTVSNAEFFSVLSTQPEMKREQTVLDIIAVGSAAMLRVQTTVDVEFVEKRFTELAVKFSRSLDAMEKRIGEEVGKRFSPTESGSYIKTIGDLVRSAKDELNAKSRELHGLLDPEKKSSAVGQLERLLSQASDQFEQMFDPDVKDSYAARLNEQLVSLFGTNGRVGMLQTALAEAMKPVLSELRGLKEKVEGRKAAEEVAASTPLKGPKFEELVHARLSQLAQPFGDGVQPVGSGNGGSRAGDFLVAVNGSRKSLVVEARDRRQISWPAIQGDLERAMNEREADFGIYVCSSPEMVPQHIGDFQVYDDKIVTTLDNLHIGYRLARLLARTAAPEGEVDLAAVRGLLGKAKDTARSLRDVKTKATQVKKLAEGIHIDATTTEDEILELLEEAEQLLGGSPQS